MTLLAGRPAPAAPRPPHELAGTRRGTVERFALVAMTITFAMQWALRPSGPGNSSPVDVFTLLSILATAIWAATTRLRLRGPYLLGAGVWSLGGILAGLNGPLPGLSLLSVLQDLVLITWMMAVVCVARDARRLRLLTRVWAGSAQLCAAVLVAGSLAHVDLITGVVAREGNRELFTFGDPNYAGTYWVLGLFITHAAQFPRNRWLRFAGYALLVWGLVLSESNGGTLELLIGCLVLVALRVERRHGVAAALALVLLVGGAAAALIHEVPLSKVQTWARDSGNSLLVNSIGRSNESSAQRGQLIGEAIQLYDSDGVLGSGPGTTKPLLYARDYPYAKEAHDDYLASLVERGPLGSLGLLLIIASVTWRAGRVLRSAQRAPETSPLPRPAGLVAALIAVAIAASYYEVEHFRFVWALFAVVAASAYHCDAERLRAAHTADAP